MKNKRILALCIILFFFFVPKAWAFSGQPTQIIIPSLRLSLPVTKAAIVFDTWDVSYTNASFGDSSALPGNNGNTVIFSHALPELFGNLPNIHKGDYIHVFTHDDWFVYKTLDVLIVNPEDIHVLEPKLNHELTLYTCTGENYTKRFVVKAQIMTTNLSLKL